MSCISAQATYDNDSIAIKATLEHDAVVVSAGIVCSIGKDTSLHGADGVLYDSDYTPIFTTE
jgi:hypothetical protein